MPLLQTLGKFNELIIYVLVVGEGAEWKKNGRRNI
jgi:hypothetical protein